MILFMEKTWFFWWMFSTFIVVRWFHVLSVRGKIENSDALTKEEEEWISDRFRQKSQIIALPETDNT